MSSLTCWFIWLERNKVIFYEKSPSVWAVVYKTLGSLNRLPQSQKLISIRTCPITQIDGYTIGCFDGASITCGLICGVGRHKILRFDCIHMVYQLWGSNKHQSRAYGCINHSYTIKSLEYSKVTVNGGLKGCY
jgi:hypothetical protein